MRISLRQSTAALALLAALVLSSCNQKTDEPVSSTPPKTTATSPAPIAKKSASPSPAASASPSASATSSPVGQAKSTTPAQSSKVGVAPKGGNCPSSDPIKGNNAKTGKIYHAPKTKDYDKVKAEACFANTAAAEKAGYRASK
jgi:hypothetical protein